MSQQRANINRAAKEIAMALGLDVRERREDPSDKAAGILNIEWVLARGANTAGFIRLDCRPGWDVEGKSWAGHVDVLLIPENPADPFDDLSSGDSLLLSPVGQRHGPDAVRDTRRAFVEWAKRFCSARKQPKT